MNEAALPVRLPVARYAVTIKFDEPLEPPRFVGAMVRSALGAAMRGIVCLTGAPTCSECRFLGECAWPAFMQPAPPAELPVDQRFSQVPVPYVIEADPLCTPGSGTAEHITVLEFSLVLVGRWLQQLPLLIAALERAAARGFGRSRTAGVLTSVDWVQPVGGIEYRTRVWGRSDRALQPHQALLELPKPPRSTGAVLEFVTPLRLQKQGSALRAEQVTPRVLVAALLRRVNLLFACHAGLPRVVEDYAALCRHAEVLQSRHHLTWQGLKRYSARQDREIPLGGLVGKLELSGEPAALASLLWIGQWLHVGKAASMGFGRYHLQLR